MSIQSVNVSNIGFINGDVDIGMYVGNRVIQQQSHSARRFAVPRTTIIRKQTAPNRNRLEGNNSARAVSKQPMHCIDLAAERIAGPKSPKAIGQQQGIYREYVH